MHRVVVPPKAPLVRAGAPYPLRAPEAEGRAPRPAGSRFQPLAAATWGTGDVYMSARELRRLRIVDLVRRWPATIRQLADLGISPRYLEWTIEAAAGDLGINCDRVVSRLQPVIARA